MTSRLALHGGTPTITDAAPHFSWPPLTDRTTKSVLDQLRDSISIYDRSGVIARLEDALCDYFGVRHAVLTSSGTAALHSLYAACHLGPDTEVIVPAYTFFATATPLLHLGATPVLADCDEHGNLDPGDVARRITDRTAVIVATHMWGTPANMDALRALAEECGLTLLEDASHAHGARLGAGKVGTLGRAAAFSMNGPKPLSAGEGGFVLTDDDDVYRMVLLHGHYNKRCLRELPRDHRHYRYAVTTSAARPKLTQPPSATRSPTPAWASNTEFTHWPQPSLSTSSDTWTNICKDVNASRPTCASGSPNCPASPCPNSARTCTRRGTDSFSNTTTTNSADSR